MATVLVLTLILYESNDMATVLVLTLNLYESNDMATVLVLTLILYESTDMATVLVLTLILYENTDMATVLVLALILYENTDIPTVLVLNIILYESTDMVTVLVLTLILYESTDMATVLVLTLIRYENTDMATVLVLALILYENTDIATVLVLNLILYEVLVVTLILYENTHIATDLVLTIILYNILQPNCFSERLGCISKVTFLILCILCAVVFGPACCAIEAVIAVGRTQNSSDTYQWFLPMLISFFAFNEIIFALIASAICCCCSPVNQARVHVVIAKQSNNYNDLEKRPLDSPEVYESVPVNKKAIRRPRSTDYDNFAISRPPMENQREDEVGRNGVRHAPIFASEDPRTNYQPRNYSDSYNTMKKLAMPMGRKEW
ncbi:hypothetical protein CHS0354_004254 [Potamilus streckersoni]|uniref:Uncharacterized protein n=1 Tax=Potamilus streckersoni TaxID=2493646 RepID=A0AAE0S4M1_9BIVA|nr:hypothetical protein CHS0354_004254 [Potamilus streckersoni]